MNIVSFTPREVAVLAGAPKRAVEQAIRERILAPRPVRTDTGRLRRMLPVQAVAYAATIAKLDLKLTTAQKKRLARKLAGLDPKSVAKARIEIAPAVEVDVGRLVGDAVEQAERYRQMRDKYIVRDQEIMGGTPIIRSTRITVYSVLGQVDHGDTIDLIAQDNDDVPREAFETAVVYARAHPFIPRPGGRPWEKVA
jgi:uncharacterized protein (DUF433 family)